MQTVLIIVQAAVDENEKLSGAIRLATAISAQETETVDLRLFLSFDAVEAAFEDASNAGSLAPIQRELQALAKRGTQIRACELSAQSRQKSDRAMISGISLGTASDLSEWSLSADKVISF